LLSLIVQLNYGLNVLLYIGSGT